LQFFLIILSILWKYSLVESGGSKAGSKEITLAMKSEGKYFKKNFFNRIININNIYIILFIFIYIIK